MSRRNTATSRLLRGRALGYRLRENLFFLPFLCVVTSVAASFLVRAAGRHWNPVPLHLGVPAATTLLATIAGAVITTTGVVFSITVVSVQLASQQFSPRVVRGFFRDRLGQLVIGVLVATFAFCVLSLRTLPGTDSGKIPDLTVLVAIVLGIGSVLLIVAYLDRSARNLYVGTILERVAKETQARLTTLLDEAGEPAPGEAPDVSRLGAGFVVPSPSDGWVQQISSDGLLRALDPGGVIRLETRAGGFVLRDGPLATVWPQPGDPRDLVAEVHRAIVIGSGRTTQQDIDFGLRQLSDIALRALSPAVNDPTTAIEAILRIVSILYRLVQLDLPAQVRRDSRGRVLLRPWDLDHEEYAAHAFSQVRLAAAAHPAVVTAIVRSLLLLASTARETGHPERATAYDEQRELTLAAAAQAGLLPADLERIRQLGPDPVMGQSPKPR